MIAQAKSFRPLVNSLRNVRGAFDRASTDFKLHHYKVRNFTPNVEFNFNCGHYTVKTANSGPALEECLRLRFEVFHREYMQKRSTQGIDVDRLDFTCDHLMIIDRRLGKLVGTYRLNSSLFGSTFYSETEFHMENIRQLPGVKLELGRACIAGDHRTGAVIALLWRGIAEYIRLTRTQVLFGCSSIKSIEPMQIAAITKHLTSAGHLTYDFDVTPTKKFKVRQLDHILEYFDQNPGALAEYDAPAQIPPLFHSYLKMGAKICGEPALDRDFYCIDFLTVVEIEKMNGKLRAKYSL